MLSFDHEFPLKFFADAPDALRAFLGRFSSRVRKLANPIFRRRSADFTELTPSSYRADGVYTSGDPVEYAVAIEVQRGIDPKKRIAWTRYLAGMFAEYGVVVDVFVLATSPAVARWARRPIRVSSTMEWTPMVIEPSMLLTEPGLEFLRANPHLVILWIQLAREHYEIPESLILEASQWLAAKPPLARQVSKLYRDTIRHATSGALLLQVENIMSITEQSFESEFFRSVFVKGRVEGREEGREEGERAAMRLSLRTVLGARGFETEDSHITRIASCEDLDTLKRWVAQAATAGSVEDALR